MRRFFLILISSFIFFSCSEPDPEVEYKTVTETVTVTKYSCIYCNATYDTANAATNCYKSHQNPTGKCYFDSWTISGTSISGKIYIDISGLYSNASYKIIVNGTGTNTSYSKTFVLTSDSYGHILYSEATPSYTNGKQPTTASCRIIYENEVIIYL